MRIPLAIALAQALLLAAAARAEDGKVDWEHKVVRCTGSGAANLKDADGNPAVARIGAEKAARLDAVRNCLATLRGVQLESGRSVGSALESDSGLSGRVQGILRGFRTVGKPRYFSDGGVEIDVEVPLEGALSDALLPHPTEPAGAAPAPAAAGGPTSLVVDARGQKVVPALAPRVKDEAGQEIYGPARLDEAGRRAGAAAYAPDLEAARKDLGDRLGAHPLVVKALRVEGSDLVISAADAAQIGAPPPAFLAQGKVVILAD
ncbi:MAG TPA: hypothetical protein VMU15_10910 [Anaeromyxobacter sp.]|nr:hypothetical protein [Anaeromyxobacter sp.]